MKNDPSNLYAHNPSINRLKKIVPSFAIQMLNALSRSLTFAIFDKDDPSYEYADSPISSLLAVKIVPSVDTANLLA